MRILQLLRRSSTSRKEGVTAVPPKGYFAVYVGEIEKKRFVIPVTYLNQPCFQDLLSQAEEEFDYCYPMGGLTIQCREEVFADLISQLNRP